MNGENLYWMWVKANSDEDCGVDAWGDLDAMEHRVWNAVAEQIQTQLVRAEDAADKGELARQTAGGMEMEIKELKERLALVEGVLKDLCALPESKYAWAQAFAIFPPSTSDQPPAVQKETWPLDRDECAELGRTPDNQPAVQGRTVEVRSEAELWQAMEDAQAGDTVLVIGLTQFTDKQSATRPCECSGSHGWVHCAKSQGILAEGYHCRFE